MNQTLESLLESRVFESIGTTMVVLLTIAILVMFPPYRRALSRLLRLFLYEEESSSNRPASFDTRVEQLDERIRALEKAVSSEDLSGIEEQKVSSFLDENLPDLVEQHLADSKRVEATVIAKLDRTVASAAHDYLEGQPPEELELSYLLSRRIEDASRSRAILEADLDKERGSAATLRTVMINLFVLFNVGLLATYIGYGETLQGPTLYTIGGSYLSLVAFIVYIVRASHFRTGVLLAIRENFVNQSSALAFLDSRRPAEAITENEVEIVKMLLVNRTERETKAQHPYEIVLKQIEGSNIQFKGGKIALGSKRESA